LKFLLAPFCKTCTFGLAENLKPKEKLLIVPLLFAALYWIPQVWHKYALITSSKGLQAAVEQSTI